ncbi:MAG: 50S ribosomal protein L5 [Candidatus Altiarchaeota archaeon]|nr:50S ribosomal protein L5 [Candidatus Altiarchaeota archaeon]
MHSPRIEKVTVNIGAGEGGAKLEKAVKLLQKLTGNKPVKTKTMKRIPTFGVRPRMFVGTLVTLRGESAHDFLKRALAAKGNKLKIKSIDKFGNFSFGIKEYIDIPKVRYDPEIGVFGMDVCVTMGKPGYRVKRRRVKTSKVGKAQLVTKEDAIVYLKENFGVEVDK